MEKIKYEVLDKIPEKNSNKKYYYFYKIVNFKNEKYYYGVHSAKYLDDNYRCSSKQLIKDIKEHGVFNFSQYGSQEYPYLSKIKLLKKEIEYLEQYVDKFKEQYAEDTGEDEEDAEEYLD